MSSAGLSVKVAQSGNKASVPLTIESLFVMLFDFHKFKYNPVQQSEITQRKEADCESSLI